MINWIRRILINRSRKLFVFWDGKRFARRDPIIVLRNLSTTDLFSPEDDLKLLNVSNRNLVIKKMGEIAAGVRDAFGVQPYEDGGLTELECVRVLMRFYSEMNALKKNGAQMPISQPSTDGAPTTKPASAESVARNGESVSSSIPAESSC